MADPKGYQLFVNIAASKARRRLKRFGHGVRKIRSAGRNQSLIIHTATGRHLAELESKFADVGFSSDTETLAEPIDNLRNLGAIHSDWLRSIGVRTISDLANLGPILAYQRVKRQHPQAELKLLWALAAGLSGEDWQSLNAEDKERLQSRLEEES